MSNEKLYYLKGQGRAEHGEDKIFNVFGMWPEN